MSSLKALAAAKSRRSGSEPPTTSGVRPGTSIASHAAFAPQYQNRGGNNFSQQQQPQQYQQQQQQPQVQSNGLPFTKLSVSDAIGLITLRLGKVEQYLIDVNHDGGFGNQSGETALPPNTKLVDNSVLTSVINRLDAIEKKQQPNVDTDILIKLETISKMEKEFKETKEMLINLMFKFELFTKETTNKFTECENAILELGQLQNIVEPLNDNIVNDYENDNNNTDTLSHSTILSDDPSTEKILSAELKNIIQQELLTNN